MPSAGAPASIPALPTPTGEVGSALSTGTAGIASWYDAKGDVAAVPWFRYGMDPIWASICTFPGMARCVSVLISDACQCYVGTPRERLIDLSRTAFAQLADPSVGVIRVTLEVPVQGARVTAPPTSVR
jgi:rare lipoprotein A (peptidoglycan hydrolase)